jgi:UDP-N-acetylmuramoylalanine--D-glutamate ligase
VIARHRGITWVDDSKATNPHAAASSLRAYPGAVWIVGGDLKGVDIGELVAQVGGSARAAVVIGVDRTAVVAAFERHAPAVPVFEVDAGDTGQVMNRVVEIATGIVDGEGTVLLAPAAASFDQFSSYADRGHRFAEAVRDWIDRGSADDAGVPPSAL